MVADRLTSLLAGFEAMDFPQLRELWQLELACPAPRVSASLLRLGLAHELQVRAHGDLPKKLERELAAMAEGKAAPASVRPGMRLVREWNGEVHVVAVGEDNVICWNDREWSSLSAVARAITGTRWSGPAFFGLRQGRKAA